MIQAGLNISIYIWKQHMPNSGFLNYEDKYPDAENNVQFRGTPHELIKQAREMFLSAWQNVPLSADNLWKMQASMVIFTQFDQHPPDIPERKPHPSTDAPR